MSAAIETVLRLVAEGKLSADEAGPILDALDAGGSATGAPAGSAADAAAPGAAEPGSKPRFARLEVRDKGRRVVDLRVPISLGTFALDRIPGLSIEHVTEVREAIASNTHGAIVDVQDEDGDGVRILLE